MTLGCACSAPSPSGGTSSSATDYPVVQLRHLDSGQTSFLTATNWSNSLYKSEVVWNFPPGPALATVFVNGIPSASRVLNIPIPVPVNTTITSVDLLTNGVIQFAFTNTIGAPLTVASTTNLAVFSTNWLPLGGVVEVAPGQFQFNDPQPANQALNFYRIQGL